MLEWLQSSSAPSFVVLGTFAVVAALECVLPRRRDVASLVSRWFTNLGLAVFGSLLVRACLPLAAIAGAVMAHERHWGLLDAAPISQGAALVMGVVLLDVATYAQHRLFHAVPMLWRVHRIHHSDLEFDCGTAIRHHPLEDLLAHALQLALIMVLGIAPAAVLLSELLQGAAAFFNHGNVALPARLDRVLRMLVVTPDMHRIHHSVQYAESNSNFSNFLSCWDHLFGTNRRQPLLGHADMHLGIAGARTMREVSLAALLVLPFRRIEGALPHHGMPSPDRHSHITGGVS